MSTTLRLLAIFAAIVLVGTIAESGIAQDFLVSRPATPPKSDPNLAVGAASATAKGETRRLSLDGGGIVLLNQNSRIRRPDADVLVVEAGEVVVDAAKTAPLKVRTKAESFVVKDGRIAIRLVDAPSILVLRGTATGGGADSFALKAGERREDGRTTSATRPTQDLQWTEPLLDDALLVPASRYGGGDLVAKDPQGNDAKIVLRSFHVDVHIEDGFARTTIDQTYFNAESFPLEGTFIFPLPADASLSRLAMYVAGVLREGSMVERDRARDIYESIRHANRDPALLEWVDGTTFKMRVFPMESRTEKRIVLSYTQRLPVAYGRTNYRFAAGHSVRTVDHWSFTARVTNGAERTWKSLSHDLTERRDADDLILEASTKKSRIDRDVVVELTDAKATPEIRFSTATSDDGQYLMMRYRPTLTSAAPTGKRHWAFLFESSGDRDPLLARTQVEVIRQLLAQLDPADTFQVYSANTRTQAQAEPQPATAEAIGKATAFLERSHLVGALDLAKAFETIRSPGGEVTLVHVGSGFAALGERGHDDLLKKMPRAQYVGVAVGRRWNRGFMKRAAEATAGHFTQINPDEPIAWRAFELFADLHTPRMLGVSVQAVDGVTEGDSTGAAPMRELPKFLTLAETIVDGEEIVAVTRVGPAFGSKHKPAGFALPTQVRVVGNVAGQRFEQVVPVRAARPDADYLPRIWARLEIDRLTAAVPAKNRAAIVQLSREMMVMSPFTSLLVLENDDMEKQYRVEGGRKDRWAAYKCPERIDVVFEPLPGQPDPRTFGDKKSPRAVAKTLLFRSDIPREIPMITSSNVTATGIITTSRPKRPEELLADTLPPSRDELVDSRRDAGKRQQSLNLGGYAGDVSINRNLGVNNVISGLPMVETDFTYGATPLSPSGPGAALPGAPPLYSPPAMAGAAIGAAAGFQFNDRASRVPADANERLQGLFNESENLRQMRSEWMRYWAVDMPGHLTPERVIGGIMPGGSAGDAENRFGRTFDYQRPATELGADAYYDLVQYAPGMNSSLQDAMAVIDAEARPIGFVRRGSVDAGVRELFASARPAGWRKWTSDAGVLVFDGQLRYVLERTLPSGLAERVECDGAKLLHLYPQLHLGAKRTVSRFHRLDWTADAPGVPPLVDDLTHNADLRLLDAQTVAVVPHGNKQLRIHFVFDGGRLVEKRWVSPSEKILGRQTFEAGGTIRLVDGQGTVIAVLAGKLEPTAAPEFAGAPKDMVVLPLPYRSAEHVRNALKIEGKAHRELTLAEGTTLLASHFGGGDAKEARDLFVACFQQREQNQLGYFVLLAALGADLDSAPVDVASVHLDDPLAQYLALHSSPVLRQHASQWAVQSVPFGDGFLGRLGLAHALLQRWSTDRIHKLPAEKLAQERAKALDFVRKHKESPFAWTLLCAIEDRTADVKDAKDFQRVLAAVFDTVRGSPVLTHSARYEAARCLYRAGDVPAAQKQMLDLVAEAQGANQLPAIDGDFRTALERNDLWRRTVLEVVDRLLDKNRRDDVLSLARCVWGLEDRPLAGELFDKALARLADKEKDSVRRAALDYLTETNQVVLADELLREMLKEPANRKKASLWRLGGQYADQRKTVARKLECLEQAIDAAFGASTEDFDAETVRQECRALLEVYVELATVMPALKTAPSPDFASKVMRTADRWRSIDPTAGEPSTMTAEAFRQLGDKDRAWDYATTPLAMSPHESQPWLTFARAMLDGGDRDLADTAAAFDAEPTDPQILWDRADNLRRLGRGPAADGLLRRIAEGSWQPRFQGLVSQARTRTRP
jgi:hypothetical protein